MSPKPKLDRAYAWAKGIAIVLAVTLFAEDWFTQWPQALRLEGSEVPTHWMPLPEPPVSQGEQG